MRCVEVPNEFRVDAEVADQVFAVESRVVVGRKRVGPGAVVEVVGGPTVALGHVASPVHVGVEAIRGRPEITTRSENIVL